MENTKIYKELKAIKALPDMKYWDELHEQFKEKYREMQAFFADGNNDTTKYTGQIAEMDKHLVKLFYDLHDVEEDNKLQEEEVKEEVKVEVKEEEVKEEVEVKAEVKEEEVKEEVKVEAEIKEEELKEEVKVKAEVKEEELKEEVEVKAEVKEEEVKEEVEVKAEVKEEEVKEEVKEEKVKEEVKVEAKVKEEKVKEENTEKEENMSKNKKEKSLKDDKVATLEKEKEELIMEKNSEGKNSVEKAPVVPDDEKTIEELAATLPDVKETTGVTETVTEVVEEVAPPPQSPYRQFIEFAKSRKTVSAKDLVKFNIPDAIWKAGAVKFTIDEVTFEKTVPGLMFNKWIVIF
jgi:hypothetical protein